MINKFYQNLYIKEKKNTIIMYSRHALNFLKFF